MNGNTHTLSKCWRKKVFRASIASVLLACAAMSYSGVDQYQHDKYQEVEACQSDPQCAREMERVQRLHDRKSQEATQRWEQKSFLEKLIPWGVMALIAWGVWAWVGRSPKK